MVCLALIQWKNRYVSHEKVMPNLVFTHNFQAFFTLLVVTIEVSMPTVPQLSVMTPS